jgi:hypothetical protein
VSHSTGENLVQYKLVHVQAPSRHYVIVPSCHLTRHGVRAHMHRACTVISRVPSSSLANWSRVPAPHLNSTGSVDLFLCAGGNLGGLLGG